MDLIVMLLIGICIFMFCVYFTRWVFGIDQIIELQKEQTKLLRKISENIQEKIYSEDEKVNNK